MEELSMEMLQEIDGGVNWVKVGGGACAVVVGVTTGVTTSPTGVGIFVGVCSAAVGLGVMIRGFEDD